MVDFNNRIVMQVFNREKTTKKTQILLFLQIFDFQNRIKEIDENTRIIDITQKPSEQLERKFQNRNICFI